MRKILLFLFLLFARFGFPSADPDAVVSIDITSCHVRGAVHALRGQFFSHRTDAVIAGFEPIPIQRSYVSDNASALNWEGGWAIFPHAEFSVVLAKEGLVAIIRDPDGAICRYNITKEGGIPDLATFHAPPFGREISGRTDLRNNRLEILLEI